MDISERAIATAREISKEENLPLTYEVADLNFLELPEKTFDLIVGQTSLHHVLFLERVAEQVWLALKGDGYLWIHDFIGETQGQYNPKPLSIMNELLAILPEKFRKNKINNRVTTEIKRSEPGHLASPFEFIRSGEIIPVFQRWFTIEWKMEFNAFCIVLPRPERARHTLRIKPRELCLKFLCCSTICASNKNEFGMKHRKFASHDILQSNQHIA